MSWVQNPSYTGVIWGAIKPAVAEPIVGRNCVTTFSDTFNFDPTNPINQNGNPNVAVFNNSYNGTTYGHKVAMLVNVLGNRSTDATTTPLTGVGGPTPGHPTIQNIANNWVLNDNSYEDKAIRGWATVMSGLTQPTLCRMWHEPNTSDWYNDPVNYIKAWIKVVTYFRTAAPKVLFIWCPNGDLAASPPVDHANFFPGSSNVDWIGVDAYSNTTAQHYTGLSKWYSSFNSTNGTLNPDHKPCMICEWGLAKANADRIVIFDELRNLLVNTYTDIKAMTYWVTQPTDSVGLADVPTGFLPDYLTWVNGTFMDPGLSSQPLDWSTGTGLVGASLTSPTANQVVLSASFTSRWTAASGGTGPYTYQISYNNGSTYSTPSSGASGLSDAHNFGNGSYTAKVKTTDAVNNTAVSAGVPFTISVTLGVPVISNPSAGQVFSSNPVVTAWSAATGGTPPYTYQISYNNGSTYSTPSSGANGLTDSHTFTDGTYTAIVKATDANSIVGTSAAVTFQVLTTAPPTPVIDSAPTASSGGSTPSSDATFAFHEPTWPNPVTFTGTITGQSAATITSPKTYSSLAPGNYSFSVTATDNLSGLTSPAATWLWTVLTTPLPLAPVITSGPTLGGTSNPVTITISNIGSGTLNIGQITKTGTNPTEFTILTDNASNQPIAAGSSLTIIVEFTPASLGSKSCLINIPNNSDTDHIITLTGNGIPAGAPIATLDQTSIAFPPTVFGTSSANVTVNITNTGNQPLTIGQTTITGPSSFVLVNDLASNIVLSPNNTVSVQVHYTPANSTEVASGTLVFTDNSNNVVNATQTVALSGSAIAPSPKILVTPPVTVAFGTQTVGTTSATQTVTVQNTGTANLIIGTIISSDTEFVISSDTASGQTLAPNAIQSFKLAFTPTQVGSRSSAISIPSNAAGSPYVMQAVGSGISSVPITSISPSSASYSGTVGSTTAAQTFTITNTGSANLVVSTVTLTGSRPGQFSISVDNASGQTIAPAGNRTVQVVYKPTIVGSVSANLTVSDNAAGSPHNVPLAGQGGVGSVQPIAHTVWGYFYLSYGLSSAEGFGGETYQGWNQTVPAPAGSAVTHAFSAPTSIASDYYPGDYWSGATGYPPNIYSSSSSSVLVAQCKAAIQAGINVLVVSWSPPPDRSDSLISTLLNAAQTATNATGIPLFVAFLIEAYPSCSFTDPTDSTSVSGGRSNANVWRAINYINGTYGAHPNFYRTARVGWNYAGRSLGANVFFLNHPNYDYLVGGSPNTSISGGGTYWQTTTDKVHNAANVPLGGLIIAESAFTPSNDNGHHFDGGFSYLTLPLTQAGSFNVSVFQYQRVFQLGFPPTAICIPAVTPGFSALRVQESLNRRFPRNNGAFYDTQWHQILNGVSLYDVGVTSFNQWAEGTQIEPATNQTGGTGI